MLTNITLWFSTKRVETFVLQAADGNPSRTRIFKINDFNYAGAREKLVEILEEIGELRDILYDHQKDWYVILIQETRSKNAQLVTYFMASTEDKIIEI